MTTIHINKFVRRQTSKSQFSHWTLTDEELIARIQENLKDGKTGYREGVLLVPVNPEGFYSSVVLLHEGDKLAGEYVARIKGEEPRKSTYVVKPLEKIKAVSVCVVLYSHALLAETKENDTDADYEVISINASDTEFEQPIPPNTLIANHFQLSGGTATNMTDEEFVSSLRQSVMYWKDKSSIAPQNEDEDQDYSDSDKIKNINEFVKEHIKSLNEKIVELGGKINEIPQPKTDQDQIMFNAGQKSLALFIQGATS
jgi:hypothetical protein